LRRRNLSATTCVVFDVLRATSSMLTALHNGAEAIIPVSEIAEALAIKQRRPEVLLAGERHGLRITRELTGSVDFDFGNSPRDFTPERVAGRTVAWTTTNGTRALRACAHAEMILLGGLVNLQTLAATLETLRPQNLLIVCSGTFEEVSYEDTFAAGALADALAPLTRAEDMSDSAHIAQQTFLRASSGPETVTGFARNARRLLEMPALADDVALCFQRDSVPLNASLLKDGSVRAMPGFAARLA
jgi:2-phosphosulfolactate phosphatase